FLLTGAAPQGYAEHVEVIGVGNEQIAEELAGAQKLDERLQRLGPAFQEQRKLLRAGRVGQEPLQAVEGHVRIGRARQQTVERVAQLAQRFDADGLGQV